jgi:hypothetical protein
LTQATEAPSSKLSTPALAGERPLYALGGGEAPTELGADLLRLLRLSPEAVKMFWQVLAPALEEPIAKETEQQLDLFCAAYRVERENLARVLKACRFLLREAAKRDVPAKALAADLDGLCPDAPLVKEVVLAGYEPAKAHLRKQMIAAALLEHGRLLSRVGWRRDMILATERGTKLQTPVAVLSLHYREGAESLRFTVHALPEAIRELRDACNEILGTAR